MPYAPELILELSHQILLDIVEAGGKGFEVDDALEFDYQGQYGALDGQKWRIPSGIDLPQTSLYLSPCYQTSVAIKGSLDLLPLTLIELDNVQGSNWRQDLALCLCMCLLLCLF